jgi:hypothetical protein
MVELGDLREGLLPGDVEAVAREVQFLPNLAWDGIGTNLACQSGVAPDAANMAELSALATSLEATFGVVMHLDEGTANSAPDDSPGWTLMETRGDTPTGRLVNGLHEDLLMLDPGGREGGDLWE